MSRMPAYTVIGSVRTRAMRVVWMLEETGLPFTHVAAMPRSAEVLEHNPQGKVPVLIADGIALTDSTAILTFLADRHARLTYPAGSVERARQDSLTQFLLDEFDASLWTASRHSQLLPQERRVPAIKDTLKWEFARSLQALAARMSDGPFLMGDAMTLPDIIATHCFQWARIAKFPAAEGRLADYSVRMQSRDAFVRTMAR